MSRRARAVVAGLLVSATTVVCAWMAHSASQERGVKTEDDPTLQTDANWIDARWQKTEHGQFLSAAVELPTGKIPKAVVVKVGDSAVCFDTELIRYGAGWSGGFLQFNPRRYGLLDPLKPLGKVTFTTKSEPGWAAYDGSFADPRASRIGNLPRGWARYGGLFQSGDRIVFTYRIGSAEILDTPESLKAGNITAFARTIRVRGNSERLRMRVCDAPAGMMTNLENLSTVISGTGNELTAIAATGDAVLAVSNGCAELQFHSASQPITATVVIWHGAKTELPQFANAAKTYKSEPLDSLTKGGTRHWTNDVVTKGSSGIATGPLVIDTLTVPYDNPWKALMFTSGHDLFENGDAAVCTVHGDVWTVSGIDRDLRNLKWRRFATGLFQPLGLKIVRNQVYVLGRDGITILHDLNSDGEADYYENFNNDCFSAAGGHSYSTCLETDSAGNFFFAKCAENTPHGGTVLKVSADGQNLQVVATGFRNPNGLGIGPNDLLTVADQQGEWVPETRVDLIRPGGFYGYTPMHKRKEAPLSFDGPLCWIARTIDNSAGGEVWVPQGQWDSLGGKMIHLSYGRCTMMLVLCDDPIAPIQAAAVPLPGRFLSGVMRGRFNPLDGNMYLTGLRGWQTAAVQDGCFQRVRYIGAPLYLPVSYSVVSNGVRLGFSDKLDRALAENADSYAVERWNYKWSSKYGSPDFSVKDPAKEGRDTVLVRRSSLSPDERTILLELEDFRPAMQMKIRYNVKFASGKQARGDVYATVNKLPGGGALQTKAR